MSDSHANARLEAFSDGVYAIALTLLIIDIRIPSTAQINTTADFWLTLKHMLPSILAFLLSFIIIFINWFNHHVSAKLLNKTAPSFIYANGLMLLTVVFVPFPTSLMGEYILTDHASPSVILYDANLALQAFAWMLITKTAINNHLYKDEAAARVIRNNGRFSLFALALYSVCAILAIWIPVTAAVITTVSWVFWLIYGIKVR